MELAFLEGPDLIIVLVIVLVLFGGSRLPGLARSLGEAQRELRKGQQDDPATPAANKPDEPGPTSPDLP
jgi:sec-independent protein translocase protein TatA